LKAGSFLLVRIGGSRIFANLVELKLSRDPIERTMLSSSVATICLSSRVLALSARAALASAAYSRSVSCLISACWFVTILAVEVSVVSVSTVREFKGWLVVPCGAIVLVLSSG
jgi:hypothetical protein